MTLRVWYDSERPPRHMLTCDACAMAYEATEDSRRDGTLLRAAAVQDGWTVVTSTSDLLFYCELCSGTRG
jgi:hypothetical protein